MQMYVLFCVINLLLILYCRFGGIFEAIVQNTLENKNKKLVFELRGEATLPHIVIHKPTLQTKNGAPLLRFLFLF
jgi:hypothetical protein